jgi:hypothetical protein
MFKLFFLGIICHLIFIEISNAQFKYPAARKEIFDTVIYGKKISDEYFWMSRKKNAEEVKKLSRQQSNLAQTILDSIPGTEMIKKDWEQAFDDIILHEIFGNVNRIIATHDELLLGRCVTQRRKFFGGECYQPAP